MSNLMIVSEDSSKAAFPTLKNLLSLITEKLDLDVSGFIDPSGDMKKIAHANACFLKEEPNQERQYLAREQQSYFRRLIANELGSREKFLIWHIDGDCKFSEYDETKGNIAKFKALISDLPEQLPVRRGNGTVPVFKDNIITMVPCYSIEAWLFQNKAFFQEIIDKVEKQLPHVPEDQKPKFNHIIENLKVLQELPHEEFDEVLKIKDLFPVRESKNFYPKMAEGLPHDELMKIDKSYAKFVKKLKDLNNS